MSLRGSDAVSVVKSVTQSANASAERKLSTDSFTVKSSLQPKNDQAYAPESNAVHQRRRATRGGETKARAGVSLGPEAAKVPENEAQVRRGQLRLDHVLVLVLVLVQASPISLYASRQSVAEGHNKNLRSSSCVGLDFKFFKFKFF
tara:strand:- start:5030 stop:5467 length:438 start_codon:yes stop_codon:yes gene_type:complete